MTGPATFRARQQPGPAPPGRRAAARGQRAPPLPRPSPRPGRRARGGNVSSAAAVRSLARHGRGAPPPKRGTATGGGGGRNTRVEQPCRVWVGTRVYTRTFTHTRGKGAAPRSPSRSPPTPLRPPPASLPLTARPSFWRHLHEASESRRGGCGRGRSGGEGKREAPR